MCEKALLDIAVGLIISHENDNTTIMVWSSYIPKGKNKTLGSSYRPTSVLKQDYKWYPSIMSNRLNSFVSALIDNDQTGFVNGQKNSGQYKMFSSYN